MLRMLRVVMLMSPKYIIHERTEYQPGINIRMTNVKVAIEADSANGEEYSDARTQADRRHRIAQQRPCIKVLLTFHQACVCTRLKG